MHQSRTKTESIGLFIYRTHTPGILSYFFTLYTISACSVVGVPNEFLLIPRMSLIPSAGLKHQQYSELLHLFPGLWCHSLKRTFADCILNCSIRSQTNKAWFHIQNCYIAPESPKQLQLTSLTILQDLITYNPSSSCHIHELLSTLSPSSESQNICWCDEVWTIPAYNQPQ